MELLKGELVFVMIAVFVPDALGALSRPRSPSNLEPESDLTSGNPALSPPGLWSPLKAFNPSLSGIPRAPSVLQEKQVLQGPVTPLRWKYPIVPEVPRNLAVNFQQKQPATPSSVSVQCSENQIHVEVQQDFFSNGRLIQPGRLTLGGCPVVIEDLGSKLLVFEYELQDCNSVLMMTEDELVYTFSLTYTPVAFAGTPITRTSSALVGVKCHYQRLQNVSSDPLRPTWVPFSSMVAAQEVLMFSLKLMMDNWSAQRHSPTYFLGGFINVEASVQQFNHVPLRVFVDSCVATQGPDVNALPRYSFIENHGCFVDAKNTGSSSHFMPQSQTDKVQFQLEAFMFREGNSHSIYITCLVRATIASAPSDALHKSCSFSDGWFAADGNHKVCSCCDSTCGAVGSVPHSPHGGVEWEAKASLGPIKIQEQKPVSQ